MQNILEGVTLESRMWDYVELGYEEETLVRDWPLSELECCLGACYLTWDPAPFGS